MVACRNRHTVTAAGWIHEQDNQKLVLGGTEPVGVIAHETGINSYIRMEDPSRLAPAVAYWAEHQDAWAEVRTAWTQILALDEDRSTISVKKSVDDTPMYKVIKAAIERQATSEEIASSLVPYYGS